MFGIDSIELMLVAVVALLVIGPKDLPLVLRKVGAAVGKARGMARHFRSGVDTMIREAELEDMEKSWQAENARIMQEHPNINAGSGGHDAQAALAHDPPADAVATPFDVSAEPAPDLPAAKPVPEPPGQAYR